MNKLEKLCEKILESGRPGVPVVAECAMDYLQEPPGTTERERLPGWLIVTPGYAAWALLSKPDVPVGVSPESIVDVATNSQGIIRLRLQDQHGTFESYLLPEEEEVYFALKLLASKYEGPRVLYGILHFAKLQCTDVKSWAECPICGGPLNLGNDSVEYRSCRRFFSNPRSWLQLRHFGPEGVVWVEMPYPETVTEHDLDHQDFARPWRLTCDENQKLMIVPDREIECIILELATEDETTTQRSSWRDRAKKPSWFKGKS